MSPNEIIDLLSLAAAYDQRTVGQADVTAWHAVLFKLDSDEAQAAVIAHYQDSTVRLMPADIYKRCRPQATRHLTSVPAPEVHEGPADPDRWHRMWEQAILTAAAESEARRAVVLADPEIARRLRDRPLGFRHPEQWTGFVPPETFNRSRNKAPEREALAGIVGDAIEAEAARAQDAAGGES